MDTRNWVVLKYKVASAAVKGLIQTIPLRLNLNSTGGNDTDNLAEFELPLVRSIPVGNIFKP